MIKGPKNVVVDTGNPWDRDHILDGMYRYCVCLKKKMLQIIESGNFKLRFADHHQQIFVHLCTKKLFFCL